VEQLMTSTFTILHVEDDPNDVLLLQRALKKTNAQVALYAVGDGDKAVSYLSGSSEFNDRLKYPLPQLILLDLKMPRKSGLEVLNWIRTQPQFKRTVVVVFTSSKHDEDINHAYELGANSYLVKPVGFEALQEMMKGLSHYWGELNQMATA
jgi:CheY-like chemotaxis protein